MTPAERAVNICEWLANNLGPREAFVRIAVSKVIAAEIEQAVKTAVQESVQQEREACAEIAYDRGSWASIQVGDEILKRKDRTQ
jgi:hypothetical protein